MHIFTDGPKQKMQEAQELGAQTMAKPWPGHMDRDRDTWKTLAGQQQMFKTRIFTMLIKNGTEQDTTPYTLRLGSVHDLCYMH